ncbi:hypothetical protein like AT1G43760 [Hibiscus trionum]|uniref:Uncharacterized protein n=1 Tax=Hibiscus trionum TaxID=183268 RepID=A0A9W7HAG5_HIBTR|nr:hypothetical protein like AT1G43760 [Hibiscus trionum]
MLRTEERAWAQKSRSKWILEGDQNTGYFHYVASNRRRANSILALTNNGVVITKPSEIRDGVFSYFSEAYNTCTALEVNELDLGFKQLSQGQRDDLEKNFTAEEVWEAIATMKGDRAPGPDGFTMEFFKTFWPSIKPTVMEFFEDF